MANTVTVNEIMTRDPVTLASSATAEEAARIMSDRNIGSVIVTDMGNGNCGIVTDRDLVIRVVANEQDPKTTPLKAICSRATAALTSTQPAEEAVRLMREKAVRRLPVVDGGRVVGIVALGDLAIQRDPDSVLGEISAATPNT